MRTSWPLFARKNKSRRGWDCTTSSHFQVVPHDSMRTRHLKLGLSITRRKSIISAVTLSAKASKLENYHTVLPNAFSESTFKQHFATLN